MKARILLGLPALGYIDEQEVKQTWRRLAAVHHPDRGGNSQEFDTLRKAYEEVLEESRKPRLCDVCRGSGRITKLNAWTPITMNCDTCGGSGKYVQPRKDGSE